MRNGRARACTIIALVTFHLIASARALVPGLCATQAMYTEEGAADTCCDAIGAACARKNGDEPSYSERTLNVRCALCSLVLSPGLTVCVAIEHRLDFTRLSAAALHSQSIPADPFWASIALRGPPASAPMA